MAEERVERSCERVKGLGQGCGAHDADEDDAWMYGGSGGNGRGGVAGRGVARQRRQR